MKIQIPSAFAEKTKEVLLKCEEQSAVEDLSRNMKRYGNPDFIDLDMGGLKVETLTSLYECSKEAGERGMMIQITSLKNMITSPMTAKIGNLKALVPGIISFLRRDIVDGWLYCKEEDGAYMPWLVRDVVYESARQTAPAIVTIHLAANRGTVEKSDRGTGSKSVSFTADDVVKKTIPELLLASGLFHETAELKAVYEKDVEDFAAYRVKTGEQFLGSGFGMNIKGYRNQTVELVNARLVNDEEVITRKITEGASNEFWEDYGLVDYFKSMPLHCRLYMFHLGLHENFWVHVNALKPYVYRPELREKLILPELHRDLIDILTQDMNVIMDDIVEGKSGGTTILCKGAPGLGKTLSAEIYSEAIKKPLYRVHSGQLGIDAVSVETNLETILNRAQRWDAVLLIDEADVFVRQRGNDIQHNAVVASFLRTLEYFSGLLFLTTNRAGDIDDAILSRCIAVIHYEYPSKEDARKIWNVLAKQFELTIEPEVIEELLEMFKKVSGRDVKELLKLTSKFARHKNVKLTSDVFRQCAMFRGL